jgi:hypothetical protein
MNLWIARDKKGRLYISSQVPIKEESSGKLIYFPDTELYTLVQYFLVNKEITGRTPPSYYIRVEDSLYPEITWENSPKRLITEN